MEPKNKPASGTVAISPALHARLVRYSRKAGIKIKAVTETAIKQHLAEQAGRKEA